jgi:integrase
LNPGSPTPQAGILNQARRLPPSAVSRPKNEELIINTLLKLKTTGISENSLKSINYRLQYINKYTNLNNPEEVKTFIATMKQANSYKIAIIKAYNYLCVANNLEWIKPKYRTEDKIPLIPTTENVQKIISASTEKYATIFTILAETGLEAHELETVTRKDIDAEKGIITAKGCKGHAPRTFKLKQQTAEMLRTYLYKHPSNNPFPQSIYMGKMWRRTRDKLAKKLQDPQIKQIPMRNLRNYSGAQLYYKLRDPIAVMRHLGHKKLETTMHYLKGVVINEEEEYVCKVAETPEQAIKLIEAGFTYVQAIDNLHLYRKPK